MTDSNPWGPQPPAPANGDPWGGGQGTGVPPASGVSGFGITALVCGAGAFLVAWIPFLIGLVLSFVPVVLAITFGIVDIVTSRRTGRSPILGIIGLALGALVFFGWFTGLGTLW